MASFPEGTGAIELFQQPITAVTAITYTDCDGNTQSLPQEKWVYSSSRRKLYCTIGSEWPSVAETDADTVFIDFTAGVADSGCVPRLMKQAILLEVGRTFFDPAQENGVNTNDGKSYENIVRKLRRTSYP